MPLTLVLPLFWGLDGILYAAPVADLAAFLVSVVVMRREMAGLRQNEAVVS